MTPLSATQTELGICVLHIQRRFERLSKLGPVEHGRFEDHRTEALADLAEAMDRIEPGLGSRLLLVMYPHCNVMVDQLNPLRVAA